MSELNNYLKFVFDSVKDTVTGRAETPFVLRQQLRTETYFAMVDLWTELDKMLRSGKRSDDFHRRFEDFDDVFTSFNDKIEKVYDKFDEGKDYSKISAPESLNQYLGTLSHRLIARGGETRVEIGKEFENFWSNFFKLVKSSEAEEGKNGDEENAYERQAGITLANYFKTGPLNAVAEATEEKDAKNADGIIIDLKAYLQPETGTMILPLLASKITDEVVDRLMGDLVAQLKEVLDSHLQGEELIKLSPIVRHSIRMKLVQKLETTRFEMNTMFSLMRRAGLDPPGFEDLEKLQSWLKDPENAAALANGARENPDIADDLINIPVWSEDFERYATVGMKKLCSKVDMAIQIQRNFEENTRLELSIEAASGISQFVSASITDQLQLDLKLSLQEKLLDELTGAHINDLHESHIFISKSIASELTHYLTSIVRNPLRDGIIPFMDYILVVEAGIPKEAKGNTFSMKKYRKEIGKLADQYAAGKNDEETSFEHFKKTLIELDSDETRESVKWKINEPLKTEIESASNLLHKNLERYRDFVNMEVTTPIATEYLSAELHGQMAEAKDKLISKMVGTLTETDVQANRVIETLKVQIVRLVILPEEDNCNFTKHDLLKELKTYRYSSYQMAGQPTEKTINEIYDAFLHFIYILRVLVNLAVKKEHYVSQDEGYDPQYESNLVGAICDDYSERIKDDIKVALYSELLQYFPNLALSEAEVEDLELELDLDTLRGVLVDFRNNLLEILDRHVTY